MYGNLRANLHIQVTGRGSSPALAAARRRQKKRLRVVGCHRQHAGGCLRVRQGSEVRLQVQLGRQHAVCALWPPRASRSARSTSPAHPTQLPRTTASAAEPAAAQPQPRHARRKCPAPTLCGSVELSTTRNTTSTGPLRIHACSPGALWTGCKERLLTYSHGVSSAVQPISAACALARQDT